MEQLGKLEDWDCVEKRGNPVASPLMRGYLSFVQGEQRRVGVGVKQAPPLVAVQLRELVRDIRRRAQTLPTAAQRIALIRDVAIFCVAFHTMKRGVRAVGSGGVPGVADVGRRGFHFQFSVREDAAELLPSGRGKEEPRLPRDLRGRSHGGVPKGGGPCNGHSPRGQDSCSQAFYKAGRKGTWR